MYLYFIAVVQYVWASKKRDKKYDETLVHQHSGQFKRHLGTILEKIYVEKRRFQTGHNIWEFSGI